MQEIYKVKIETVNKTVVIENVSAYDVRNGALFIWLCNKTSVSKIFAAGYWQDFTILERKAK
jgi:hypothetical protein